MDTNELRRAGRCVYIAVEETVAADLARLLNGSADEIERLQAENEKLRSMIVAVPDDGGDESTARRHRDELIDIRLRDEQRVTPDPSEPVTDPFQHQRS